LPYYKEIADLMENFDVNALKTLKNTLDNLDMETQELEKKNEEINYDVDVGDINTEELINDNKSLQILQDINKDFSDTLNFLDEKISVMKEKMDRNNIPQ
jgi:DNA repair exonuclease SbcCD ATPase subunit